jgi:hypothetical protein
MLNIAAVKATLFSTIVFAVDGKIVSSEVFSGEILPYEDFRYRCEKVMETMTFGSTLIATLTTYRNGAVGSYAFEHTCLEHPIL